MNVIVVLDLQKGAALEKLRENNILWVASSPINDPVIKALWETQKNEQRTDHLTLFKFFDGKTPSENLWNILPDIILHHPEAKTLQVVGHDLSEDDKTHLKIAFSLKEVSSAK